MRNSVLFALILSTVFLTSSSTFADDELPPLPPMPESGDTIHIIGGVCNADDPSSCGQSQEPEEEKNCFKYTYKVNRTITRGCICPDADTTSVTGHTFGTVRRIDGILVDFPKKGCYIEFVASC